MFRSAAPSARGRGIAPRSAAGASASASRVSSPVPEAIPSTAPPPVSGTAAPSAVEDGSKRLVRDLLRMQTAAVREACLQWLVGYLRALFSSRGRSCGPAPLSLPLREAMQESDCEDGEVGGGAAAEDGEVPRRRSDSNASNDSIGGGEGGEPSRRVGLSSSQVHDRLPALIDWLQKVLCVHTKSSFRVSAMLAAWDTKCCTNVDLS